MAPNRPVQEQFSAEPVPRQSERRGGLLKGIVIAVAAVSLLVGAFFAGQQLRPKQEASAPAPVPTEVTSPGTGGANQSAQRTVSCTSTSGPDSTTTSQQFTDVEGTNCSYRSGSTAETLVLQGKLTGRNTSGTGMSVTLNVNGKDCQGGESLNYSASWSSMTSLCTFNVPANSAVAIKWRFLSPFGGTASILRSSANIAPYVNGVAIPQSGSQSGGS